MHNFDMPRYSESIRSLCQNDHNKKMSARILRSQAPPKILEVSTTNIRVKISDGIVKSMNKDNQI